MGVEKIKEIERLTLEKWKKTNPDMKKRRKKTANFLRFLRKLNAKSRGWEVEVRCVECGKYFRKWIKDDRNDEPILYCVWHRKCAPKDNTDE